MAPTPHHQLISIINGFPNNLTLSTHQTVNQVVSGHGKLYRHRDLGYKCKSVDGDVCEMLNPIAEPCGISPPPTVGLWNALSGEGTSVAL